MSELRVALAMGGGVSLGSFCGGAVGESMKQLLENPAEKFDSVRFDVFSGASAGAMSLGLLVHTLAHPDFAKNTDAPLNRQREAWVERVDIQNLIPDPKMKHVNSLLDRGAVDKIAKDLLLLDWEQDVEPDRGSLGPRVLLSCTLANLNGIPVDGRKAGQGAAFLDALQTTLYEDIRIFDLRLDPNDGSPAPSDRLVRHCLTDPRAWNEIAATCVAAGAFPMAFEPVALERKKAEYGSLWPKALSDISAFPFTFSDGGMFNNEPLREVMNLIGLMDAENGDFERVVLFIDPNLSGTKEDLSLDYYRELEVHDPDNTLWKLGRLFDGRDVEKRPYVDRMSALASPLFGALAGQAAFKDWLAAEKVNNRLEWRADLRSALIELFRLLPDSTFDDGAPGDKFATEVTDRLRCVLEAKGSKSIRDNPQLALDSEERRIRGEKVDRLDTLPNPYRQACVHLLSLVDQVAGLRGRKQVRVLGIGPVDDSGKPVELAGNFVANFGGFFREEYRQYDFDMGRERAGKLLADSGLLSDECQVPERPAKLDIDPTVGTTPESQRLLSRIKEVAGNFLDIKTDWPLKLDKLAVRMAKGKFGRVIGNALSGSQEQMVQYVVRIEIVPIRPGNRFKLAGMHGGDSLDAEDVDSVRVIETLIFFAPFDGKITGPHVNKEGDQHVVKLVQKIRFRRDKHRFLALPDKHRLGSWWAKWTGRLCEKPTTSKCPTRMRSRSSSTRAMGSWWAKWTGRLCEKPTTSKSWVCAGPWKKPWHRGVGLRLAERPLRYGRTLCQVGERV